jgi:hypothetical protein
MGGHSDFLRWGTYQGLFRIKRKQSEWSRSGPTYGWNCPHCMNFREETTRLDKQKSVQTPSKAVRYAEADR